MNIAGWFYEHDGTPIIYDYFPGGYVRSDQGGSAVVYAGAGQLRGRISPASGRDAMRAGRADNINLYNFYTEGTEPIELVKDDRIKRNGRVFTVLIIIPPSDPEFRKYIVEEDVNENP